MTITDLKTYAERMEAQMQPADRLNVTLTRGATAYIMAYLHDRERGIKQALADPKISDGKRAKRELELGMVTESIKAIEKAKLI